MLFCDTGRLSFVRLPLAETWVVENCWLCALIRSSTSAGLKATLALSFWTASSNASSMAQWFLMMLIFGHVARSPESMAWCMKSFVGFESIRGKWAYEISGKIVISPEYFWLRTDTVLVKRFGRIPMSARVCIRCNASPLARCERLLSQVGPGATVEVDFLASSPIAASSLTRNGTT